MPRGITLPPGPALYPECSRPGTSGARRHWIEGTVTCEHCRAQQRIKVTKYRRNAARLGRRTVPSLGTQRRIQALGRWGYTRSHIGQQLGVTQAAVTRIMEQDVCWADTAARVARVYRDLVAAGKPGPSAKTRARAIAADWAGPMDWNDIDRDEVPLHVIDRAYDQALEMERHRRRRMQRAEQRQHTDTRELVAA